MKESLWHLCNVAILLKRVKFGSRGADTAGFDCDLSVARQEDAFHRELVANKKSNSCKSAAYLTFSDCFLSKK